MNAPAKEDGRVGLLIMVCLMVVILVVMVGSGISAVQVQRSRLLACADALSLAGAQTLDANDLFSKERAQSDADFPTLAVNQDSARVRIMDLAEQWSQSTCDVGSGIEVVQVRATGAEAFVELRTRAELPLVPGPLNGVVAPVLTVSATGRME
ncbi:MAG: hypothetical protein Q4C87_02250 [Actinomycetaceae bacterium]|nr:hypothetical protein [Actinomycetaceae bacterium]